MKITLNKLVLFISCCLISLTSCKDAWKEHQGIIVGHLNKTILEELSENTNTSEFYKLIIKSEVNKILVESRAFTIWAPNNSAIQQLDDSILSNGEALRAFVLNHISYQTYFVKDAGDGRYIQVLNGKNIRFETTKFEGYPISDSDIFLKNGVLHVIEGSAIPKLNTLEYLESLNNKQYQFINQLYYEGLDASEGVVLYYDPFTELPVYQDGTTKPMTKNHFLDDIYDISSEDSLSTYIILSDAAFDYEVNALKPYNAVAKYELGEDSIRMAINDLVKQDSVSKWEAVKDLVIKGVYTIAQLNDSLITTTGVQIKINPSDIVSTKLLSNGIAYVVNKVNYKLLENKIPTIKIEGVEIDSLRAPSATIVKTLKDFHGQIYEQRETGTITSSPSPLYYFRYKAKPHSTRYAIYWRARNTVLTVPFSMGVAIRSSKSGLSQFIPELYQEVPIFDSTDPNTFKETFVGYADVMYSGTSYVFVMSSQGATSALPTALALNYIKLVPIN